ncbi:hypothetical protein [Nocardia sp. NPDC051750]|uniref:DUF7373 family lipoprotein n=1 Tax=Nocardia sp. NPDC051750 TaxID=3364325 RepID=UPI0037AF9078
MTPVALDRLDVGLFPTEPTDFTMNIDTNSDVYSLESRRMLGYLVSPYEADPDLRYLWETDLIWGSHLLGSDFDGGTDPLPEEFKPVSDRNFLISGAATARWNNNARSEKRTTIAILRFPSPESARTAAAEYNHATDIRIPGRQKLELPGYTDTYAALTPSRDSGQLSAASGSFVVYASIVAPPEQSGQMTDRMKKILDLQLDALQELTPTAPDDILDLPTNPDGILSTTLPSDYLGNAAFAGLVGAYTPAAYLNIELDAEAVHDYSAYGVDLVARNEATVYRTAGTKEAFALQTALTRAGRYDEVIPGPPGIADARCLQREISTTIHESFYCVIVYDRYVASIDSYGIGDLPATELYQATAAQYAILANSR